MISNMQGKRLLILGANPETTRLVRAANAMGVETFVADNNPRAHAKQIAHRAVDIDGSDVPALATLVMSERIDGVMLGVADRLLSSYHQLCQRCGLPCYTTKRQSVIFNNKRAFNSVCVEHGLNPIPSFPINLDSSQTTLESVHYPVLVKPSDGCSGKGLTVARDPVELRKAITVARLHSASGDVLVEEFMECDDVGLYFVFSSGAVYLSAMFDRYTDRSDSAVGRVCFGALYPSKHLLHYLDTAHAQVVTMLQSEQVSHGVMLIQAFVRDGRFFFYDPGFRLQGEAPDIHVKATTGIDHCQSLVAFALTGRFEHSMIVNKTDPWMSGRCGATLWLLASEGIIASIDGLDELERHADVIGIERRLGVGSRITSEMISTEGRVVARIYICSASKNQLAAVVDHVRENVRVTDVDGHVLARPVFDAGGHSSEWACP